MISKLTTPMFDSENVVFDKSPGGMEDLLPSSWRRFNSLAISTMFKFWTSLTFGTIKPSGVSIAIPILWLVWTRNARFSSSSQAFSCGNFSNALDAAFMKNGIKLKETPCSFTVSFTSFRQSINLLMLHSSLYTKCGMLCKHASAPWIFRNQPV